MGKWRICRQYSGLAQAAPGSFLLIPQQTSAIDLISDDVQVCSLICNQIKNAISEPVIKIISLTYQFIP